MLIETESGLVITTESGNSLVTDDVTNGGAVQVLNANVNVLQALLWQYNNAQNLQAVIQNKQNWYNLEHQQFWQNWITNVFNLKTANEFGLSVWSILLNLPLFSSQPPNLSAPTFGFDLASYVNFDNGNFNDSNGITYMLPLETKRTALRLRYYQLVSSGTVPETNRALADVFGSYGTAYLRDNHDMTQTYIFQFPVTWDLAYLFNNFDLLPRPAGVSSTWIDATLPYFGFDAAHVQFDSGILGQ